MDALIFDLPENHGGDPLTSGETFSGGEEFTYDLKNLKRAAIVGERTGGGAHLVGLHHIDDHYSIGVPFARAINPISKTDWEGSGVEPHVKEQIATNSATRCLAPHDYFPQMVACEEELHRSRALE